MTTKPLNIIRAHIVIANGDTPYEAPVIDNALLVTLNVPLHKKHKAALGIATDKAAYIRFLVAKPAGYTDLDLLADHAGYDPNKPPAHGDEFDVDIKEG